MADKNLEPLLRRLLAHPWVLRFLAKATRLSPNELTAQIQDAVLAAKDADKLGMRDQILANADAIKMRRQSQRTARVGTAGTSSVQQIFTDDVRFIYDTMYMFEGKFSTLNRYLENKSPEQKLKMNTAIWEELGIETSR